MHCKQQSRRVSIVGDIPRVNKTGVSVCTLRQLSHSLSPDPSSSPHVHQRAIRPVAPPPTPTLTPAGPRSTRACPYQRQSPKPSYFVRGVAEKGSIVKTLTYCPDFVVRVPVWVTRHGKLSPRGSRQSISQPVLYQSTSNQRGRPSLGSVRLALSRVAKMAAAALQESPEWDLPRLRSSFGFEVRRRTKKSREEARTKSRVALRRQCCLVQDDYRHLKTKNKTDDENSDKDTGAQHAQKTPNPEVFFVCSQSFPRVFRRQVLPLRS